MQSSSLPVDQTEVESELEKKKFRYEQLKKTDKGNDQEVSCQEVPLSGTSCVLQSSGCLFSSFILFFLSFEKGKDGKIGVVEHR